MRGVRVTETTESQDEAMDQSLVCLWWRTQKTLAQIERRIFTNDQMMKQQRRVVDDVGRSALLDSANKFSRLETAQTPRSSLRIIEDHLMLIPNRCDQMTEVEDYRRDQLLAFDQQRICVRVCVGEHAKEHDDATLQFIRL